MKWENFSSNTQLPIAKHIAIYIVFAVIGTSIGIAMQVFSRFPDQYSQNVISFMASDFGCWAVIAVVIATYARTKIDSGGRCFVFMMTMVCGYYAINFLGESDIGWFILAALMFPIGMFIYNYQKKKCVFIILELGLSVFLVLEIIGFAQKILHNQMVVVNANGIAVLVPETWFSLGNYALLIVISIFGILFTIWHYKKSKVLRNQEKR